MQTSIKTAPKKTTRARRVALGWSDLVRAVQSDEARFCFLDRYRAAGFTPDHFGHLRTARETAADALSRTEDMLEGMRGPRREEERQAIRVVRRRLELELWS